MSNLIGCCYQGDERLLVDEFMPNDTWQNICFINGLAVKILSKGIEVLEEPVVDNKMNRQKGMTSTLKKEYYADKFIEQRFNLYRN